jgi:phosphoglycerate kinase
MEFLPKFDIDNKVVLCRLNLNVPIENGEIKDDFRIRAVMPTIEECKARAKKTIIMAHLGRPEGMHVAELSLKPIAEHIQKLLGSKVLFVDDCIGGDVRDQIKYAADRAVIFLENVRFHPEEEQNDETFGQELARNGEVFINDAFGDSAKEHASVIWPAKLLPSAGGFRLQAELDNLGNVKDNPKQPFIVIIGGAKIKEKLGVIESLGGKADKILVGGGVANTFFKAQGFDVKESLVQDEELDIAKSVLEKFDNKIFLPVDVGVAKKLEEGFDPKSYRYTPVHNLEEGEAILDIGIQAFDAFEDILSTAQTIFWAGPLGLIEWEPSARNSVQMAHLLAGFVNYSLAGGGETAELLKKAEVEDQIDFVSTGGGAALKYLSGKELPGIAILQ